MPIRPVRIMALCLIILSMAIYPARAQTVEPVAIVQSIYAPFTETPDDIPSDFDLIYPYASPELRALIDREKACWEVPNTSCKYDFCAIANGQDYEITDVQIAETWFTGSSTVVTASFNNLGQPTQVDYLFSNGPDGWQLEDILEKAEPGWSLREILK